MERLPFLLVICLKRQKIVEVFTPTILDKHRYKISHLAFLLVATKVGKLKKIKY
jgi:hypothetical protein